MIKTIVNTFSLLDRGQKSNETNVNKWPAKASRVSIESNVRVRLQNAKLFKTIITTTTATTTNVYMDLFS